MSTFLRLCLRRARQASHLAARVSGAFLGIGTCSSPFRYLPVSEAVQLLILPGALKDNMAAIFTSARSEIENVVGGAHDFRVVFDNEHRVSDVAQPQQNLDQALCVARM